MWHTAFINILDPTWWWRYCFRRDFSHFDLPKMSWSSQWSDSLRFLTEEPAVVAYLSALQTYTRTLWQPGEQEADFCKQMEKNILKEMILMYYSCQREENTKMIHLKPLKPGDNPHACGVALGEKRMRKPLYIPLRSTWLNQWYICMLICLISLLQMSYRHIKGLTLRHNDIRASEGGLWKYEAATALNLL